MQSPPTRPVVLCIDDEASILYLLQSALRLHNYQTLAASNGEHALRVAAARPVSAIILDYRLPDIKGDKLAAELKRLQPNSPIIMFSGSPQLSLTEHVDVFVRKGEGLALLLAALRHSLESPRKSTTAVRRFQRYPVQLPLKLTVSRSAGVAVLEGVSIDVGQGGVGGRVAGDLVPGEVVMVQISDSRRQSPLESRAQVRYRRQDTYGFQFCDVSPRQQADMQELCDWLASA